MKNTLSVVAALTIALVAVMSALASSTAAALNSASITGLVCLAGLLGVFGLAAGLAVGAAGYALVMRRSPLAAGELPAAPAVRALPMLDTPAPLVDEWPEIPAVYVIGGER